MLTGYGGGMKRIAVVLTVAALLASCTKKNVSAHSTILGWDIPQSVTSQTASSVEMLDAMAKNYELACGERESFDLIQGSNFADEFEKMVAQKGYTKTAGPNLDTSSIFLLTGPKSVLTYVSPQKFAACELH